MTKSRAGSGQDRAVDFSFILLTQNLVQLTCTDRRVPRLSPRRLWQQHTQRSTESSKRHLATAKSPEIVGRIRHERHTRLFRVGRLSMKILGDDTRALTFIFVDRISPLFGPVSRQNRGDHHAAHAGNDKARSRCRTARS